MRFALAIAVLLLALTPATAFAPAAAYTPREAARAAAGDYIAPLVRPDTGRVTIDVARCRRRGDWHGCRVLVAGVSACNAVVRVQVRGREYLAWVPRMRCR